MLLMRVPNQQSTNGSHTSINDFGLADPATASADHIDHIDLGASVNTAGLEVGLFRSLFTLELFIWISIDLMGWPITLGTSCQLWVM